MNAADRSARDSRALDLRRAGVSLPRIVEQLGFSSASVAESAIARAIKSQGTVSDPSEVRALEMDRLDRMQSAVWVKAMKGDLKAVETAQKLSDARVRLAGIAERGQSVMTDAFDSTVAALTLAPEDAALVAAGRRIADRIDAAAASGDAMAETKALYLVPHLMNVLRELGATPSARDAVSASVPAATAGERGVSDFESFKRAKGGTAVG